MPNALLKGTFADLLGNELGTGGGSTASTTIGWTTKAQTAETNGRYYRTSNAVVKLQDGRFFTAGGEVGSQTTSEIINATGTASVASGTTTANRTQGVRLVLLNNGDVLVVGGNASPTTSETWNPGSGTFTARGACTHVEDGGIMALDNGNAVVYGGISSGVPLNTTQIYSATGFTWSASGNMVNARTAFGRTFRVPGGTIGKLFVAGGTLTTGNQTATTEMYDGDTGTWTAKASMSVARGDSCNVKLPNGDIMVAGGVNTFGNNILSSVEIYSPTGDSWSTVGPLNYARLGAHGVALPDGRVVIAGGIAPNLVDVNLPTELYDPTTGTWSILCGALNYTPASPSDPLHQVYGADLALLDGGDGFESIIAVGGKAAAPGTFPSTSLRDIRHLETLPNSLFTLKNAYDNQGAKPFIFGTDTLQSFAAGKAWKIQSPEPTFTNLFAAYADSTANPTDGSGVAVGGTTFRSNATKNIFDNGPTTFGSRTFSFASNTVTIPSDKQIVRLISTIGDVSMNGTPIIAPGLFEGQRLITIVDSASTGFIEFSITGGGGIQPIASPTRLNHYGFDYQEALEWVWTDGYWKTISTPAQNPITIPVAASLSYWTEAQDSSGVNSTVPVSSFTPTGTTTDAAIVPLSGGSLLAQVPDGTATGGDKRGAAAVDFQRYRSAAAQVASGDYSFLGSGINNTVSCPYGVVVGGDTNTVSGTTGDGWNVICGGQYNTLPGTGASTAWNFIGGGSFNSMSNAAQNSAIVGGAQNYIGPGAVAWCFAGSGFQNNVSPAYSGYASILNGNNNEVLGRYGTVLGGAYGTDRGMNSRLVWSAGDEAMIGPNGIHQTAIQITKAITIGSSPTPLTTNGSTPDSINMNGIPPQFAYKVRAEVVAIDQTTGDTKAWTLECLADNTGIIGTPPSPVVVGDSGVAWTATLAWDATNVAIYVEATGAGSNNISWTSTMWTTEVGY